MSPEIMPPPNSEIVIGSGSTVTIGGGNVGTPDPNQNSAELINPDAIGPVTKFEMWHKVNGVPTLMSDVTGVRIPMGGSTVLQIVQKALPSNPPPNTRRESQWSIVDGSVLSAYTDRTKTWWPANIKTAAFTTANNECGVTRAADPLDPHANWTAVTSADFVTFKFQTWRP